MKKILMFVGILSFFKNPVLHASVSEELDRLIAIANVEYSGVERPSIGYNSVVTLSLGTAGTALPLFGLQELVQRARGRTGPFKAIAIYNKERRMFGDLLNNLINARDFLNDIFKVSKGWPVDPSRSNEVYDFLKRLMPSYVFTYSALVVVEIDESGMNGLFRKFEQSNVLDWRTHNFRQSIEDFIMESIVDEKDN